MPSLKSFMSMSIDGARAMCCRSIAPAFTKVLSVVAVAAAIVSSGQSAQAQTTGACCRPTTAFGCLITTPQNCQQLGGLFLGGQSCGVCDTPGTCCVGTNCFQVPYPGVCLAQGGTYFLPPQTCTAASCGGVVTGACCDKATGQCILTTATDCPAPKTFYPNLGCQPSPCEPQGACCNPATGACQTSTQSQCVSINGQWFANTSCTGITCSVVGACCNAASGNCVTTTQAQCPVPGNTFFPNLPCSAVPACQSTVVCCLPNGQCVVLIASECDLIGGTILAGATGCNPSPCIQTGACCRNGVCTIVPVGQCPTGFPFYPNTGCAGIICPPVTGACCLPSGCLVVPQSQCPSNLVWVPGTSCFPNDPCPPLGACCRPGTLCFVTTQAGCLDATGGGGTWYPSTPCTPVNPCIVTGACCSTTGGCTTTTQTACGNGLFYPNGVCQPNPCPVGGCCDPCTGRCTFTTQVDCVRRGGNYLGNGVACTPRNCRPAIGACCNRFTGQCYLATQAGCTGNQISGWSWIAGGTCAPNPCRRADYNGDSAVTVQDIFDFLQSWFAPFP